MIFLAATNVLVNTVHAFDDQAANATVDASISVPRDTAARFHAGQHIDVVYAPDDPSLTALNPEPLRLVQKSELGQTLGRARMYFNLEEAVKSFQAQEPEVQAKLPGSTFIAG